MTHLIDTSVIKRLQDSEIRFATENLLGGGQIGRSTICDLEVGCSARNAEEVGLVVLHDDSDFDRMAEVSGQRVECVVPAGTVD